MESSISANKSEGITHHTNHKRHTIRRPTTIINKSTKDIRSTSMRSKSDERDENGEEAKNMKDQNETFKLGQHRADECVDEHSKQENRPEEESSHPKLRLERLIVHRRHSQDHVTRE